MAKKACRLVSRRVRDEHCRHFPAYHPCNHTIFQPFLIKACKNRKQGNPVIVYRKYRPDQRIFFHQCDCLFCGILPVHPDVPRGIHSLPAQVHHQLALFPGFYAWNCGVEQGEEKEYFPVRMDPPAYYRDIVYLDQPDRSETQL